MCLAFDRFNDTIGGLRADYKVIPQPLYGLMMGGVDDEPLLLNDRRQPSPGCYLNRMLSPGLSGVKCGSRVGVRKMLVKCPSAQYIDKLR